jgi:hypothetical protein
LMRAETECWDQKTGDPWFADRLVAGPMFYIDPFGEFDLRDADGCYACNFVDQVWTVGCDICNGPWEFTSDHYFNTPPFTYSEPFPEGCRRPTGSPATVLTCTANSSGLIE